MNPSAEFIFMVFVRKQHVMTCSTLQDGVKAALMLFVVLMDQYPKEASFTWEILQQVFGKVTFPNDSRIGLKVDENGINKCLKLLVELLHQN